MNLESIQAEINLLHKQLDAKQIELDNKYAEFKSELSKLTLEQEIQLYKKYYHD
jgi:hypothetical protein|tara:strand:- start:31 stop:192 length:162 start_codon:yes stop_codon:yes gene_type:complete